MKANDTRAKGMVFNQKAGEYIQELEQQRAALRENAQAVMNASERAIRETSPQTPYIQPDYLLRAIAALLQGEGL